ncbi:MAG: phosphoribosylaminoimidazolesuccinocarboxamide synthase [Dehalococcoidia bacterium]|nr:phosphoribosylaminoimidazolesuccinocarboxamide synthase [Dehalococcoidia bacterium]
MTVLQETNLPFPPFRQGKVRDIYKLGNELLIVATDRISAFDSVMPTGIPCKGKVLTQISAFWFEKTAHIIPNHLIACINDTEFLNEIYPDKKYPCPDYILGRSILAKKAERISIECIARGYLAGSAWEEYSQKGSVSGLSLPPGLEQCEQLPQPVFTPSTKADEGHDLNISMEELIEIVGEKQANELKEMTLSIYQFAEKYARSQGIIIADTKIEFGIIDDKLVIIDELLTPDSSRFWDASTYRAGKSQPSFDKQILRDWLTGSGWNKEPPAPQLPEELVDKMTRKYKEVYSQLTEKFINC